jgi:CheY-like chemotaxis protein
VQITVSDTGSGIAPEELDKIFEPYYTTKETGKGTGLGLALVHGTVTKYGGSIMVDSQLGQGSVFTILLPSSSRIEERKISETEELPGGSETILLVDDELPIVKLTQQNLKKLGYRVIGTTDSREALEIFRADPHKFHLVISDMTMPHITGDKMAIELMKIRADIPVIISTGFSNRMSSETASEMDIKALVSKPVSKKDLANTIRRVLDQAGREQNL